MKDLPNIILITTDQQRYDTICASGYDYMKTPPNIDRLAKEGVFTKMLIHPILHVYLQGTI